MTDVSNIIGFEPNEFILELNNSIDSILVNHVETYKKDIKKLIISKGNKDFNERELEKAGDKLLDKMRQQFHRNMDKFDAYCSRNIFIPSSSSSVVKMDTEDSASSELEQLRQKYMTLRSQCLDLSASIKAANLFLTDMRASLFQLRVGAQVLDDLQVQPLAETMATLTQQKISLQELTQKTQELSDKIEISLSADLKDVTNNSQPDANSDKIITKGDITAVTRSVRGK